MAVYVSTQGGIFLPGSCDLGTAAGGLWQVGLGGIAERRSQLGQQEASHTPSYCQAAGELR